jgi:hypothetical protein
MARIQRVKSTPSIEELTKMYRAALKAKDIKKLADIRIEAIRAVGRSMGGFSEAASLFEMVSNPAPFER